MNDKVLVNGKRWFRGWLLNDKGAANDLVLVNDKRAVNSKMLVY